MWRPEHLPRGDEGAGRFVARAASDPLPLTSKRANDSGYVLGLAAAPAIVGVLAIVASTLPAFSGGGTIPRGLMLVVLFQLVVAALLRAAEYGALMRSWFATLVVSGVQVPLLALQVTLLREPYVSWERGSASPSLIATLIVSVVLVVGAVWAVSASWLEPDVAGLLFLPQAMIVPAFVGMRAGIQEQPAVQMLGLIMLLASGATALAWVLSPSPRLFVPPLALAVEFVLLWLAGYGPWFHPTSGDVVRLLYSVMLALTVVLVVAVPFTALWVKHGAAEIRAARRRPGRTVASPPQIRGPIVPR